MSILSPQTVNPDLEPNAKLPYAASLHGDLHLGVFYPPRWSSKDRRAAIVLFFGGGWAGGHVNQFYGQASRLAALGMLAICPEYRTKSSDGTDPFAAIADAKAAIRWVRAHAGELGADPNRIAAGGGSAGGHIALAAAVLNGLERPDQDLSVRSTPDLLVLYNPVVDTTAQGFGIDRLGDRFAEASPVHHLRAGLPPAIVFHGEADTTVPFENVQRFCQGMERLGNTCELIPYPGANHGFFNASHGESAYEDTLRRTIDFLRRNQFLVRGSEQP